MNCAHTFGTGRHNRQADITLLFQYISKENSIKFFGRIMRLFGTIKNKNISSLYNRGPSLRRGGTVQHLRFMLLWDSVQRRFGTWVNT